MQCFKSFAVVFVIAVIAVALPTTPNARDLATRGPAIEYVNSPQAIPCGYVLVGNNVTHAMMNTGQITMHFAINGEPYYPNFYHVNRECDCRIHNTINPRGGPVRTVEVEGAAEGLLCEEEKPTTYDCWNKSEKKSST